MSGDNSVRRFRTWKFSHTLYTSILPEARSGLHPTSTNDPFVLIKSLFDNLFKQGPEPVIYIHLRVSRAAYDLCVACGKNGAALPDLPFAGFIQARSLVGLSCLQPWLDALWTPVGSKLRCDPQYKDEFLEPDHAAFVYFLVLGEPALGTGGRKRRNPKATPIAAPPPTPDQFFLSLLAVNHGIRKLLAADTIQFFATIQFSAPFSHAISIESDLDLAREACACLHWIQFPGRVSYAALPETARLRLHGLLGLGSNATFDRCALDQLMSLAPGQHGPAALPASAGAASAGAAGTPAAPAPPVRAVPSALPALRSHGSAPDGLARRSGYLCSRSPESARHRPLILLFAQEESLHLSPCLQPD